MQKRTVVSMILALILTSACYLPCIAAQEAPKESEPQAKPADSYKVDFTVNELDNGKKMNSRSYSMLIRAEAIPKWSDTRRLRVGSRVPVPTGAGPVTTYQDQRVGTNIDCRLMPMEGGKVAVSTKWEYSTIASEQAHDTPPPVFREANSEVEAIVPLDKPTVLAEMDDVASTRRYVFEVKVTKLSP